LGAALYRVGAYEEALAALRRAEEANAPRPGESHPADVAFMAVAWQRLGRTEQASIELERLRALIQDARYAESEELQTLLGEAEAAGRSEP
jgi:tetratricopeptide (TPR) repeat protein